MQREALDDVIVTIGATPVMPDIPGIDSPHVVTGEQVLMGSATLGKRVVVAGGGSGVEVAHFIATRHEMNRDLKAHLEAFGGYDAVGAVIENAAIK